jgi:hypothetical protein
MSCMAGTLSQSGESWARGTGKIVIWGSKKVNRLEKCLDIAE